MFIFVSFIFITEFWSLIFIFFYMINFFGFVLHLKLKIKKNCTLSFFLLYFRIYLMHVFSLVLFVTLISTFPVYIFSFIPLTDLNVLQKGSTRQTLSFLVYFSSLFAILFPVWQMIPREWCASNWKRVSFGYLPSPLPVLLLPNTPPASCPSTCSSPNTPFTWLVLPLHLPCPLTSPTCQGPYTSPPV